MENIGIGNDQHAGQHRHGAERFRGKKIVVRFLHE